MPETSIALRNAAKQVLGALGIYQVVSTNIDTSVRDCHSQGDYNGYCNVRIFYEISTLSGAVDTSETFVFIAPDLPTNAIQPLVTTLKKRKVTCSFNPEDANIYGYDRVIFVDPRAEHPELLESLQSTNKQVIPLLSEKSLKDDLIEAMG